MTAPAGPCEWCGGPQNWTIASGVMYVRCKAGCQSLFGEERVTIPPPSEIPEHDFEGRGLAEGTSAGGMGLPRKGSEANGSASDGCDLPF